MAGQVSIIFSWFIYSGFPDRKQLKKTIYISIKIGHLRLLNSKRSISFCVCEVGTVKRSLPEDLSMHKDLVFGFIFWGKAMK